MKIRLITNEQLGMKNELFIRLCLIIIFPLLIVGCESETKMDTVFTELSSDKTKVTFANNITEDEQNNIIQYLYYYNGGGVAAGDSGAHAKVAGFYDANLSI